MAYGFGFCISDLKYKLTYDLNGGNLSSENPVTYTEKTENFTLNNPTKEGYTFKGWSGTELVGDENTSVTIEKGSTGDRQYLANYIPNAYYIKFNANSGTGSLSNQTLTYDLEENLAKNIFTKTGYKFIGWNTLEDGTGISYLDKEEVINLTTINGEVINLYAQWELLPTRYAVQIYGINQDVDENDNVLGLTFGPATGANYNNAYVTHEYVLNEEGTYNIEIVTTTVSATGEETETSREVLVDSSSVNVTRTAEQVAQRQNINLHEMTWTQIAAIEDKTLFEDCMLCGDTKKVELTWNEQLKSGLGVNQYGDGAGVICKTIKNFYHAWNPNPSQNSYVGSEESGVELDEYEIKWSSNAKNAGGYSSSHIRATLIGENEKTNRGYAGDDNLTVDTCVFSCIQEDLRDLIAPKKVKYVTGTNYTAGNYVINSDIADSIWLFSDREVRGTGIYSGNALEGLGESGDAYKKFTEPKSKFYISDISISDTNLRVAYNPERRNLYWWLRSITLYSVYFVRDVSVNGSLIDSGATGVSCLRLWLLP